MRLTLGPAGQQMPDDQRQEPSLGRSGFTPAQPPAAPPVAHDPALASWYEPVSTDSAAYYAPASPPLPPPYNVPPQPAWSDDAAWQEQATVEAWPDPHPHQAWAEDQSWQEHPAAVMPPPLPVTPPPLPSSPVPGGTTPPEMPQMAPPAATAPAAPAMAASAMPVPVAPPRRARPRRWTRALRTWGWAAAALLVVGASIGGFVTLRNSDTDLGVVNLISRVSAGIGLRVEDVSVVGRERVSTESLLEALQIRHGSAILAFDAEAARKRLEEISWIEKAVVERRLPNVIYVKVEERRPLALWQHDGKFSVIDAKGVTVVEDAGGNFSYLPVVIGDDAPGEAEALLMMLATEPDLHKRVTAAVRVGGRRWNLRLDNGIDVKLPEDDPAVAWSNLAELARNQGLLNRDIVGIDLRMTDRMLVQLTKESADRMLRPPPPPKRNG